MMKGKRVDALIRAFTWIVLIDVVIFLLIDLCLPQLREPLSNKNQILEWVTVGIYCVGIAVGIFYCLRLSSKRRRYHHLAIPMLNVLGLLEEIGYGADLFHFPVYKVFSVNIDSAHDFFSVIYKFLGTYILVLFALIFFLCRFLFKRYGNPLAALIRVYPAYKFAIISVAFMLTSVIFDLYIIYHPVLEEVMEMNAAIALVFASVSIHFEQQQLKQERRRVLSNVPQNHLSRNIDESTLN